MGKIVVTEFMSLDGVIENPAWSGPYWNDDIAKFKGDEMTNCDALLLGRVTYQGFAAAWPDSKDVGAPRMNSIRKYVVSTTLDNTAWNNSIVIRSDAVDEIAKLKNDGQTLLVYGSGTLIQTLIKHDLVDDYRLLVYPVVLGKGQRLFQDGASATLKLVESNAFGSVTALCYQPDRSAK